MDCEFIGAIKIIDGLFLGDQFAAQDLEYVVTNKVTRIINAAGKQIPNHWESIGIIYLTFPWLDNESQVEINLQIANKIIFDQRDEVVEQCYKFIEASLNLGESVIVHSVRGHNRSVSILCSYFMKKFRWTLYKTLQFMHNRRPDLEIRANFFNQLLALESRFQKLGFGAKTYDWEQYNQEGENIQEEMLIRNTFLNSQGQGVAEFKDVSNKASNQTIKWLDAEQKNKLVTLFIPPYDRIDFSKRSRTQQKQKQVQPIVKGTRIQSADQKIEKNSDNLPPQQQQVKQQQILEYETPKSRQQIEQQQVMNFQKRIEQPKLQSQIGSRQGQQNQQNDDQEKSLSQLANKQLQQKFKLTSSEPQNQRLSQTQKKTQEQRNNGFNNTGGNRTMGNSNENWFKKEQGQQLPVYGVRVGRPSTAPNQNNMRKSRNVSQNQKDQQQQQQGRSKKRLQSPNNAYHANPYVQNQFKKKATFKR